MLTKPQMEALERMTKAQHALGEHEKKHAAAKQREQWAHDELKGSQRAYEEARTELLKAFPQWQDRAPIEVA